MVLYIFKKGSVVMVFVLEVAYSVPLQVGACPLHCPLFWQVLVCRPSSMNPLSQV